MIADFASQERALRKLQLVSGILLIVSVIANQALLSLKTEIAINEVGPVFNLADIALKEALADLRSQLKRLSVQLILRVSTDGPMPAARLRGVSVFDMTNQLLHI